MQKISFWFLSLFLFLLPWQTRWIWQQAEINGVPWEYGTFSIYVTEILLWIAIILLVIDFFLKKEFCKIKLLNCHIVKLLACSILFLMFFVVVIWHSTSWEISYQYIFHVLEGMAIVSCLIILNQSKTGEESVLRCHSEQSDESATLGRGRSFVSLRMTSGFKTITALWLGGVVQGAFALWQFLSQNISANKWLGLASHAPQDLGAGVVEFGGERWLRAYGSFGSPNSLGIYLAVCLVVGLIVYNYLQKDDWKRILISAGQIIITVGLVLSFSRSAWIAAVCGLFGLLVVVVLSSRFFTVILAQAGIHVPLDNKRPDSRFFNRHSLSGGGHGNDSLLDYVKQLIIISAPAICLFLIFQPIFLARFKVENRLEYKSVYERVGQYSEFKRVFINHPLLGAGPGVYTLALSKMNPVADAYELQPAHNIYLLTLAEWGIVGFVFWLIIYVFIIREIWKKNKVWITAVIILLVAGLFDHWNYTLYSGMMLLWTVIAFGLRGESGRN